MDDDHDILLASIASFAEHLIPEAFAAWTRAHRVMLEDAGPRPGLRGADAQDRFRRWVERRIDEALCARWPHDRPLAIAFTSDGALLRRYDECGCSRVGCVVTQVQREVVSVATPWVFGAALPRPQPYWEQIEDEHTGVIDEVLRQPTQTRWLLSWYAEARGGGLASAKAGLLHVDGDTGLAAVPLEPRATPVSRQLHRMLYRHPARRRHPLRRR